VCVVSLWLCMFEIPPLNEEEGGEGNCGGEREYGKRAGFMI
jgi:hypothetical protein